MILKEFNTVEDNFKITINLGLISFFIDTPCNNTRVYYGNNSIEINIEYEEFKKIVEECL